MQCEHLGGTVTNDFLRLQQALGTFNSSYGLNLTMDQYMGGYAIFGYDFTPSRQGGISAFATPNVQRGTIGLQVDFNEPVPQSLDLSMLVFAEINQSMLISKDGTIELSTYQQK